MVITRHLYPLIDWRMKIGIYSKFEMAGGSEFRCVEMANAIRRHSAHESFVLTKGNNLVDRISSQLSPQVPVVERCLEFPESIYEMDYILIVNSDSQEFTTVSYWESHGVDLRKVGKMGFLFNFVVSPARTLFEFEERGVEIQIFTGNRRFFNELGEKDKHRKVAHFPRMILESPIDASSVFPDKTPSDKIRIGKHSKPLGSKWNKDHVHLIERINQKHGDSVIWDFMGGNQEFENSVCHFDNVILRKQFSVPVNVYLRSIDIFLFYLDWGRQECWARSMAEALMSGSPALATDVDGGNRLQIIQGSNGYLCKDLSEFEERLSQLIETPEKIAKLARNAKTYSRSYTSEEVVRKFLIFAGAE